MFDLPLSELEDLQLKLTEELENRNKHLEMLELLKGATVYHKPSASRGRVVDIYRKNHIVTGLGVKYEGHNLSYVYDYDVSEFIICRDDGERYYVLTGAYYD